jgi:hypothetical protein
MDTLSVYLGQNAAIGQGVRRAAGRWKQQDRTSKILVALRLRADRWRAEDHIAHAIAILGQLDRPKSSPAIRRAARAPRWRCMPTLYAG